MIFFLKRMGKRFPVFLLLLIAPVVAVWISGTQTPPPAGFYMPDADPVSARITGYLLENGFVEYEDPVLLREQVCAGKLDCGAVFPEELKNKVATGELEGCIVFYTAPASYIPQLYKNHIAAAMYREYAPYITAAAFEETAVTPEQVLAEYEAMFADGYAFSFDVTPLSQQKQPDLPKGRAAGMGATAILLMISMLILTGETVESSFGTMLPRLGLRKSIIAVLLPETGGNILCAGICSAAGLFIAGFPELLLPTVIYSLLLAGLGLALAALLGSVKKLCVLLPVLIISAAGLCPIYTDLSLVLPAVSRVRQVIPAYWLWQIPEAPGLWTGFAVMALAAGAGCVVLRYKYIGKDK